MEQKKLLWVIFSAVGFVFIVAAAGLVLFWPNDKTAAGEGEQPAAGLARDFDPVEWVQKDQEYPGIEEDESGEGDNMILVYGESEEEAEQTEAGEEAAGEQKESTAEPDAGEEAEKSAVTGKDGVEIEVYQPDKAEKKPVKEAEVPVQRKPTAKRMTEYWIQAGSYTSMLRAEEVKS